MDTIQNMFEHLHWANERLLKHLRTQADNKQAVRLFAHILHSEKTWFTRLSGRDSSHIPLWPDAGLSDCSRWVDENNANLSAYLSVIETNGNWEDVIAYQNQTGASYATSVRDILTHLALHGQYHRGQINTIIRSAGGEPVNVDYITYIRELS